MFVRSDRDLRFYVDESVSALPHALSGLYLLSMTVAKYTYRDIRHGPLSQDDGIPPLPRSRSGFRSYAKQWLLCWIRIRAAGCRWGPRGDLGRSSVGEVCRLKSFLSISIPADAVFAFLVPVHAGRGENKPMLLLQCRISITPKAVLRCSISQKRRYMIGELGWQLREVSHSAHCDACSEQRTRRGRAIHFPPVFQI